MKSLVSQTSRFGAGAALLACGAIIGPLLSGCGGGSAFAGPLPNPNPSSNANRIAFSSNRDGNFEIYTMNPDGSDVKRLTNNAADDRKPAWNRGHSKIAFVSNRDGNEEIYVVNVANGQASGEAQRITESAAIDRAPSWSPDGSRLVFESGRDAAQRAGSLYIVNVNTRVVRRLTQRPGFFESNPAWSPRGDLIAFESQPVDVGNFPDGAPRFLSTIKVNGDDLKQLTPDGRRLDGEPAWHPNGQSLIFSNGAAGLSTINADGTNEVFYSALEGFFDPVYSPNGNRISCIKGFSEGEFGNDFNTEVFVLNANEPTNNPQRLMTILTADLEPSW